MKTKWIVALLMVLIAATLAGLWASRQPAKESAILPPPPRTAETVVRTVPARAPLETPIAPVEPPQPVAISPAPKPQKTVSSQPQATKQPKEPLHDPDARDALALVGIDSQAEDYWLDAIFDTSLPDKERDDLMEDLNEVGFSNPENVTADDLPLIVNRLQIIDQVLPYADDFMAAHLLEAQKDLSNMYAQAAQ